jgi:hypothetical protein
VRRQCRVRWAVQISPSLWVHHASTSFLSWSRNVTAGDEAAMNPDQGYSPNCPETTSATKVSVRPPQRLRRRRPAERYQ